LLRKFKICNLVMVNFRLKTYTRIETDLEGQFSFDRPYFLLIYMQLGGNWAGPVKTN